ncbi:ROK family protein [Reichenbachiella ulvae]|uniref:ROK family protein n=1 Tax=Reichenbachiella ulvae TaxID=2980104 RepID=A0ABT3CNI3_9BACT|nr:ROK family protein [Reichenbachiella ulvae]MCV9385270.1 ROK family protein [Reichenbachiella ulvae]
MKKRNIVIGAYVGGKGFKCAAIDMESKSIVDGSLVVGKMDKDAGNRHIIPLWSLKLKTSMRAVDADEVLGIGFSIPGPFDYEKGIGDYRGVPKYESLHGCDISEELKKRVLPEGNLEFRYINDGIGFALGQDWVASGKNSRGISLIIDEGLGSAFLMNNLPVFKGRGVPEDGATYKVPFRNGIADDFFSIRGLIAKYSELGHKVPKFPVGAIQKSTKDQADLDTFSSFGKDLGEFLDPILSEFNPEYVSFGGLIGNQLQYFSSTLQKALSDDNKQVQLQTSEVGDDSFLFGAARLFQSSYWPTVQPLLAQMD